MGLMYSSVVCAEPDEVFAWHSRPGAITRLMPPWQPVRVAREAPSVRDGVAVLALPAGLRWVAGHDPGGYDPPRQFADVLQPPLGAALRWRHTHQFAPAPGGGTLVVDVVDTPGPRAGAAADVRVPAPAAGGGPGCARADPGVCPAPLTVALTGSSGVIGSALTALLSPGGHRVIRLVRRPPRDDGEREWRPGDPGRGCLMTSTR